MDDHPVVRTGLSHLVSSRPGFEVVAGAGNCATAMSLLRKHKPNIAIVDISLGGANGIELARLMVKEQPDIKVLIASMHDERLYAERALRAGAKGYIMKDAMPDELIGAIDTILQGDVYLSKSMASDMVKKHITDRDGRFEPLRRLTDREFEVFEATGQGLSTRDMAEKFKVSPKTIESHKENIKKKLSLRSAAALSARAVELIATERRL